MLGQAEGEDLPYHAAILIADGSGRAVLDIGPDLDDLRAGRVERDPNVLVARAVRVVNWLNDLQARVTAWIEPLGSLEHIDVRPFVDLQPAGRGVIAGVRLIVPPDNEFDRITRDVRLLAEEDELARNLDPLFQRILRKHRTALDILQSLQHAVESWRVAEQHAATSSGPLVIGDTETQVAGEA